MTALVLATYIRKEPIFVTTKQLCIVNYAL